MKRLLACLSALLLLCAPCRAAELAAHRVEEVGMGVSLPQDWVVFTPDTPDDHPGLAVLDTDGPTLRKAMETNHMALNAVTSDMSREITVQCFADSRSRHTFDYNLLDKDALNEQAQAVVDHDFSEDETTAGVSYDSYQVYPGAQAYFLRFTGRADTADSNAAFLQYGTVINGYAINISLHEYHEGPVSDEGAALLAQVVDSVIFDEIKEKTVDPSTIAGFAVVGLLIVGICVSLAFQIRRFRRTH